MKFLAIIPGLFVSIILIGTACKKPVAPQFPGNPGIARKVQFLLYTDKDFSHNNSPIVFTLSIKNAAHQTLWDSVLPPMAIREIPDAAHKLVAEKAVPGNDPSLLQVGFYYSIQNVGNSWYLDSFRTGETFKIMDFNFR